MNLSDESELSSDEELKEAFAAGLLKPGLNVPVEVKEYKNNVVALKEKLMEFQLDLPWIEKMAVVSKPAPMAPEIYEEMREEEKKNVARLRNRFTPATKSSGDNSLVLDDFKREMLFHRQAQATLIEGVTRLHSLGMPTKRPDDYFAEMAKSDSHMQKIRESLAARRAGAIRSERLTQIRRQRKLNKQIQVENKLKQQEEKKKLMNEVEKFRKGVRKNLSFLDSSKTETNAKKNKKSEFKRKLKDEKFGFGGKKRGLKRNTKQSTAELTKMGNKFGVKRKALPGSKKRLGKNRRMKMKSRK